MAQVTDLAGTLFTKMRAQEEGSFGREDEGAAFSLDKCGVPVGHLSRADREQDENEAGGHLRHQL